MKRLNKLMRPTKHQKMKKDCRILLAMLAVVIAAFILSLFLAIYINGLCTLIFLVTLLGALAFFLYKHTKKEDSSILLQA